MEGEDQLCLNPQDSREDHRQDLGQGLGQFHPVELGVVHICLREVDVLWREGDTRILVDVEIGMERGGQW